jgi:hypothetical protein
MKRILSFGLVGLLFFAPLAGIAHGESKQTDAAASQGEVKYWITGSSGKRHNSSCRWFGKTKSGHFTTDKEEGSPCGICGG